MRKPLLLGILVLAAAVTGSASAAKSITVIAPNGGEMWCIGDTKTIKWSTKELPVTEKLKILIDREGDGTYDLLAYDIPNTGSYDWEVTGPATSTAKICISCYTIQDYSDKPFEILECVKECGPTIFTVKCKSGGVEYEKQLEMKLAIVHVVPGDPHYGDFKYKYIYTLTNKDEASYPNLYLGYLHLGNCEAPFYLAKPKSGGVEIGNWTTGTSPGDIKWVATGTIQYGIQPGKSFVFCVYTDQGYREGTVSITGLFKKSSYGEEDACGCDVEFCVPGCPRDPGDDFEEGCYHKYNLAQVYPVMEGAGGVLDDEEFPPMRCWKGYNGHPIPSSKLAIPGVFALANDEDGKIDINAFVSGFEGDSCCAYPVIQSCALFKVSPRSNKCQIFGGYTVEQFGRDEIRTWWPLAYTMPGTTFKLVLQGVCKDEYGKLRKGYKEQWCWQVVANPDTFCHLIDLFHTNALGECEVPSIPGEDTYMMLKECCENLKTAWDAHRAAPTSSKLKVLVTDAVMECEALILSQTLWLDYLDAPEEMTYPYGVSPEKRWLPGNKAIKDPEAEGDYSAGVIGLIDTDQNPAACKLIVDLEYIQLRVNGEIDEEIDYEK